MDWKLNGLWQFEPVWPLFSDLSHKQHISTKELHLSGFLFRIHFSQTLQTLVCKNPKRSADSEIITPACEAPTNIPLSEALRSHFLSFQLFAVNINWSSEHVPVRFYVLWCFLWMSVCINCMHEQMYRFPNGNLRAFLWYALFLELTQLKSHTTVTIGLCMNRANTSVSWFQWLNLSGVSLSPTLFWISV